MKILIKNCEGFYTCTRFIGCFFKATGVVISFSVRKKKCSHLKWAASYMSHTVCIYYGSDDQNWECLKSTCRINVFFDSLLTSSSTFTVFLQLCKRVVKLDVVGEL